MKLESLRLGRRPITTAVVAYIGRITINRERYLSRIVMALYHARPRP